MTQTPPRRAPAPTKWRRHRNPRLSFLSPVNNKSTRDRSSPQPQSLDRHNRNFWLVIDSVSIPITNGCLFFHFFSNIFLTLFFFFQIFFFCFNSIPSKKRGGARSGGYRDTTCVPETEGGRNWTRYKERGEKKTSQRRQNQVHLIWREWNKVILWGRVTQ